MPRFSFAGYLEYAFDLSSMLEVPGVRKQHAALIQEMWKFYPDECKAIGLTDGLKENA